MVGMRKDIFKKETASVLFADRIKRLGKPEGSKDKGVFRFPEIIGVGVAEDKTVLHQRFLAPADCGNPTGIVLFQKAIPFHKQQADIQMFGTVRLRETSDGLVPSLFLNFSPDLV